MEERNRLVLIGNGFDLAHGLKTSYKDFIYWYFNEKLESIKARKPFEDDLIRIQNHSPYILPNEFESLSLSKQLEYFKNRGIQIHYNSHFFQQLIALFNEKNWVDIERYYFEFLKKTSQMMHFTTN